MIMEAFLFSVGMVGTAFGVAYLLTYGFPNLRSSRSASDSEQFSTLLMQANKVLAGGDTAALRDGISLLRSSLKFAGGFSKDVHAAIYDLLCASAHHDKANMKGPWNRGLDGYGVVSWNRDLHKRDIALQNAWGHLKHINNEFRFQGGGQSR